ncbi:putative papain-like cysteine peptidase superfamily [Helianthus anomalus]
MPTYTMATRHRYKVFNNNMELVLKLPHFKEDRKDRKINEYDLVLVPIIWQKHFYVACFNLKHSRVDVLDKSAGGNILNIKKKYDGWVESGHMETYMGLLAGWECGLAKEDAPNDLLQKQLNDLRIKYTAKILLHRLMKTEENWSNL